MRCSKNTQNTLAAAKQCLANYPQHPSIVAVSLASTAHIFFSVIFVIRFGSTSTAEITHFNSNDPDSVVSLYISIQICILVH